MSGILDYKEYNDLFATVKDVIEHFPSEQYTLPYSFNNLGTQGYTATIHYQSFIVDRFTYTQQRIPDFSQSLIKGYFPAKTISQPSTSTLQLPKDMYVYPMYPERLVDTPVTLVSYRFYKGTERFTRQLLLIENWEPGMTIGNPADDPDYTPIDQTAYQFAVNIALNTSSFTTTGTLTVIGTSTAIGAITTSTAYFDNTATITIKQGSNILYSDTANFTDGSISLTAIIGTEYFPNSLVGHTYTITTGSFTTSTFNYTATITESYNVILSWQSLQLPDGIIIGGSTSTIFSITTTLNQTTNLVPVTVSVIDTATNTATTAAWSNTAVELRAQAQLQTNYPESADQVEFWADFSPDYLIQNYVLPEQDVQQGVTYTREVRMPRKIENNQVLLTSNETALIGKSFQFPYILRNGFVSYGPYSISTNTAIWSATGSPILLQSISNDSLRTIAYYQSQPIDITIQGTGTYTTNLSANIGPVPTAETYIFGPRPNTYLLKTFIELYKIEYGYWQLNPWSLLSQYGPRETLVDRITTEGIIYGHMAEYNTRTLTVNNVWAKFISDNLEYKIRVYAYLQELGRSNVFGTNQIKGYGSATLRSTISTTFSRTERLDTGTYTITNLVQNLGTVGGLYQLNKNWQVSPYRSEFYTEQGQQLSLPDGTRYYPSKKMLINNKLYEFVSDELDLITFYGLDRAVPQPFSNGGLKLGEAVPSLGSSFSFNSTQTYRVVETNTNTNSIVTDPLWYNHNPEWWATIRNQSPTFTEVGSGQSYTATTITSLIYTKGVNTPYYDGAYVFNKFLVSGVIPAVGSQFRLAGTTTSPTTTTFVVNGVAGTEITFAPAYTIATTGSLPQWQQDNQIYNHFVTYEMNRPIGFIYDVYQTSQGTLLAVYNELDQPYSGQPNQLISTLVFDNIPYNLRIGATFRLYNNDPLYKGQYIDYIITGIDAFRNILNVTKTYIFPNTMTSYRCVGQTATFTNPASPATTSTFLGTATQTQQIDDIFRWRLNRTLPQGNYSISARVRKSVLTGTNVSYIYPTSSTQNYSVSSSDGISAGLYMTLIDEGYNDRVVVTSNVNTARDPTHFYVYPTPVTWVLNSSTYSTSPWVRQGTSFIQTATLVINKNVLNPTFYADWPGTLNYAKTYSDQILFTPDQIAFMPPNTTTVFIGFEGNLNLNLAASVQNIGMVYPLQDDYIPDGTITFTAIPQNYNYTTGVYSSTTPTSFLGTGTLSYGATHHNFSTLNLENIDGWPSYYRVQAQYSGDVYRYPSTATSGLRTIVPIYHFNEYCNEIKDRTNGVSFHQGTYLQLTRFNNPDPYRILTGQQWVDVRIDAWLEPLITNTWTSSLSLTNAVVRPWVVESIDDFGHTDYQSYISAEYNYNLPQPPQFPNVQYQFKVYHYENAIVAQRGYEVKRSMRFVAKFYGTSLSKAVNWINLYLQISTPSSFSSTSTGRNNCFRLRGRVVSVNWSNTDPY